MRILLGDLSKNLNLIIHLTYVSSSSLQLHVATKIIKSSQKIDCVLFRVAVSPTAEVSLYFFTIIKSFQAIIDFYIKNSLTSL